MRALLLLLQLPLVLTAAEPLAGLRAWPAIVFADEQHRIAISITTPVAGDLTVRWDEAAGQTFAVPVGTSEALLPLPGGAGLHRGDARLGGSHSPLAIRLSEVTAPWPATELRDGRPVDAQGIPVVLVDHRRSANDLRRERIATIVLPRPTGRPLLVGDPLATPLGDAWQGVIAECRPAIDDAFPQHAALVALRSFGQPDSMVWSPGNASLFAGTWTDEGRLCQALARRCAALAIAPQLIVALPPWPVATAWREPAQRRRQALTTAAQAAGWSVLDLAELAGDPLAANRLAPGLYAEYPVGPAQKRLFERYGAPASRPARSNAGLEAGAP